jgi:putative Holliday junction resolvase
MTVLGLDVGDRRIGVAVSDPTGLLARPLTVIIRRSNREDAENIRQLAQTNCATQIIVGLPLESDDHIGEQARRTLAFVRFLKKNGTLPVVTWDERFSTREAEQELIAAGVRRSHRRERLDSVAAAVLLEEWLASQRTREVGP